MKILCSVVLLSVLSFSNVVNANDLTKYMNSIKPKEPTIYPLDDNGHLNITCKFGCDIHKELKYLFSFYDTFLSESQVFNFFSDDQFIESITLKDYLDEFYSGVTTSSTLLAGNNIEKDNAIGLLDMPLECKYDPDYSCEQWVKNDFINYISSQKIELTINQPFIDGNYDARRIAISLITSHRVGKLATQVAKALKVFISANLTATATAVATNEVLTSTNWYQTDLKAGDTLVIKGGKLINIRSSQSSGSGSEGGSNWDGVETLERGFVCMNVWTNSGGGDIIQQVCY